MRGRGILEGVGGRAIFYYKQLEVEQYRETR